MRFRILATGALLGAATGVPRPGDAQRPAIVVRMVDARTVAPLAGVAAALDARALPDTSDDTGALVIATAAAGHHTLVLRKVGFVPDTETVTVNAGWTTSLRVTMRSAAVPLPRVSTRAPKAEEPLISGFDTRRAKGGGFFFDREQIDSAREHSLDGLLRGHTTAGLMAGSAGAVYLYSPSAHTGRVPCFTQVFFDGVRIFTPPPLPDETPPDLRHFLNSQLEAVEYYPQPASTPIEFRGGMAVCGTLLLWGRMGK